MNSEKLNELLYEALETEKGGVKVYETAIRCAVDKDLKEEWEEYLEQTQNHVQIVTSLFEKFGLDTEKETPGREIVRHIGNSLIEAMEKALAGGNKEAAQKVAAECVVHAETKDHANWELIGLVAEKSKGEQAKALKEAYEEVEEEEDEHLYHTQGWMRELSIKDLGLPAVTPPPEEKKDVKTAIDATRAKSAREKMVKGKKTRAS
jgi:rubrerythrin